ncbi:DUF1488 domain-containing protein [Vibrio gallicus]|uniref:DUF1488 domain-containing protein n=1 Tax=Vibrio gallicus TaxID=190897 RepID=UPI0021C29B80|nr:DUF1488 domain-containing protein [Vibrio gallicus]
MNQSIIFTDQVEWLEADKVVSFSAQQNGQLIECRVAINYLEQLSQLKVEQKDAVLKVFAEYRFDLEDLAEELIEAEEFNSVGQIVIS